MKNRSGWETAITVHAKAVAPREACGAIVESVSGKLEALPLRNVHPSPERNFLMDGEEWGKLMAGGKVRAYYHSHPDGPAEFSEPDKVLSEETGLPCYLYDVASDTLSAYAPSGWHPPLEGRLYMAGVNDCFTLVRDWHRENTGIELALPPRTSEMMLRGVPGLMEHIEQNALVRMTTDPPRPQRGDVLLMHLRGSTSAPNHCAVHIGAGEILHQLLGHPSRRDPWGGFWEQITTMVLRPAAMMPPPPTKAGTEPEQLDPGMKLSPP